MPQVIQPNPHIPKPAGAWLEEAVGDLWKSHEAIANGARYPGISTGIKTLDQHMGGLQEGLFLLLAAPGVGKTRFALYVARQAALEGYPVCYVTADEGARRLSLRLACMDSNIRLSNMTMGCDPSALDRYTKDKPEFFNLIDLQETTNIDPASLGKHLKARIDQHGARMGLLVVDYIQAMASTMGHKEMRMAVSDLSAAFRDAALECKSPALVVSAVSRGQYDNPTLSAGKESGDLEFRADGVFTLTQRDKSTNELELEIQKNRWGERYKKIDLVVNPSVGTIQDADHLQQVA